MSLPLGIVENHGTNIRDVLAKNSRCSINGSVGSYHNLKSVLWVIQATKIFQLCRNVCLFISCGDDDGDVWSETSSLDRKFFQPKSTKRKKNCIPCISVGYQRKTEPKEQFHRIPRFRTRSRRRPPAIDDTRFQLATDRRDLHPSGIER